MGGRLELKYLVSDEVKSELLTAWSPYLEQAPFTDRGSVYPIRSLYFDSPDLRFYREKVDGEAVRSKVRLRGYGYHWPEMSNCFVEVKRKVFDRILKIRKSLGGFEPVLMSPRGWRLDEHEGLEQAGVLASLYQLRPAVETFYLREAWESPFCDRLRLTFDSTLIALQPGQRLDRHMMLDSRCHCLSDTEFILEIKANDGLPSWVARAIVSFDLVRISYSKYCTCLEKAGIASSSGVYA